MDVDGAPVRGLAAGRYTGYGGWRPRAGSLDLVIRVDTSEGTSVLVGQVLAHRMQQEREEELLTGDAGGVQGLGKERDLPGGAGATLGAPGLCRDGPARGRKRDVVMGVIDSRPFLCV